MDRARQARDPVSTKSPRTGPAFLAIALAAAVFAAAAGLTLFSAFMLYDDEGYVLFSLRNFVEHGRLYREVYSQYGPLPYVIYDALHALGMPLTHTAGRLLTLAEWTGCAMLAAGLVWRATRELAGPLACLAATFVYLWVMVSEPNHPGGLIAFLTAVLATAGYARLRSGRSVQWAGLAGAGIAALALTKINIGIFVIVAAGSVWLLFHRSAAIRRRAPWVLAACLAVLPFGLMKALIGTPWVDTFAILFAVAAVLAVIAASRIPAAAPAADGEWDGFGGGELAAAAAGAAIVGIVVCAVVFLKGSSPLDLVRGTILGPLQHPGHFSLVFHWNAMALPGAAFSCALLAATLALRRRPGGGSVADTIVAGGRIAAAGALAAVLLTFPDSSPDHAIMSFAAPCLWLFLWPLSGDRKTVVVARAWVGFLFLGQWLHAYPVPGSQVAWGTFLAMPLASLGAWEAAAWLLARAQASAPTAVSSLRAGAVAARLALVGLAAVLGFRFAQVGDRFFDSRSLDLPGAEALRLPDSSTALYRLLSLNAAAHADILFSLPGMFSFNLWTGIPAPTLANVTHWFSLLGATDQEAILRVLQAHPRSCVIVQTAHLDFLRRIGIVPSGALPDYIASAYVTAFAVDGFEFKVRRGRRILPLSTAELYWRKGAAAPGTFDSLLRMRVLLPEGRKIATVEIAPMDDYPAASRRIGIGDGRIETTPVTLQGVPRGPAATASLPLSASGPELVDVYFDRKGPPTPAERTWVILRDQDGAELALLRLLP